MEGVLVIFTRMFLPSPKRKLYRIEKKQNLCIYQTQIIVIRTSSSASSISSPTISPLSERGTRCGYCSGPCYHPIPETSQQISIGSRRRTYVSREQGVCVLRKMAHLKTMLWCRITKTRANNTPCSKREQHRPCLASRTVLGQCFLRSCTGLLLPGAEIRCCPISGQHKSRDT